MLKRDLAERAQGMKERIVNLYFSLKAIVHIVFWPGFCLRTFATKLKKIFRILISEVIHLWIIFFAITMTWLFGGLHLAFGKLWLAIFFAVFDVFTVSIVHSCVVINNQDFLIRHGGDN